MSLEASGSHTNGEYNKCVVTATADNRLSSRGNDCLIGRNNSTSSGL